LAILGKDEGAIDHMLSVVSTSTGIRFKDRRRSTPKTPTGATLYLTEVTTL
jgi:hypothetical protein